MTIEFSRPTDIPLLRTLWKKAFGDSDAFLDLFFTTAYHPRRCLCVKDENDRPVAALYWFDCLCEDQPLAYLYAVATDPTFRGRGLCRQLMALTHAHLEKAGYAGTILVPGTQTLFQFYEKMGYQIATHIGSFHCKAVDETTVITTLSKKTYAALRRRYLPCRGVIQEQESLDFLEKQAVFYQGEDFLLAARGEGDTLVGLELLGNPDKASAVVKTLGYSQGSFRTPNGATPFAMYLPLKKDAPAPPAYFAFAFD